ncbi:hypothetical protein N7474_006185 [Penicillium riverlandense]|uniref:uncharacterized protein n=1 Tax=Penicillium riverlandense TaxID=1903569 RepID=UPI00254931F6|nr:uncharacterized protein N7474_006185 [Penicillium riverlandense]KAJ5820594.1 hypothetical protein N7474_006185 [Penicillium riverlandense]
MNLEHVSVLFDESPRVLVEEYRRGEEGTVTVLPPSMSSNEPPYSGKLARSFGCGCDADPAYADIMQQCETVGGLFHTTAPIRIDI